MHPKRLTNAALIFVALTCLVRCAGNEGAVEGGNHAGNSSSSSSPGGSSAAVCNPNAPSTPMTTEMNHLPFESSCNAGCDIPAPRQLRRLTAAELNSTLVTLFNDPNAPQANGIFDNDPEIYTFHNVSRALNISNIGVVQVMQMAQSAGMYASTNAKTLWPSCQTMDANCEGAFISGFGERALRAPLDPNSQADYLALMQGAGSFSAGVGAVVTAMLESPLFLFRSELGESSGKGGAYTLTPYEVASELSYLLVGSMPDDQLFAAAKDGSIMQATVRQQQAERLLGDPRAHAVVDGFFLQWLGVADLPSLSRNQNTTTLPPATATDMVEETRRSIDDLVFTSKGTFKDLHTLSTTYVNSELAMFYGLNNGPSGDFNQVSISGQRDIGVLNQGAVITAASEVNMPSPVLRGRMLREHILCQSLPAPPKGVPAVNGVPAGDTTRDVFVAHVNDPTCASCHTLMDPMAFSQGTYDTLGRKFPGNMENGQPIDTSGTINGLTGQTPVTLRNATDLSNFVANNADAQACLARHWSMYGLGNVDWPQDACTFQAVNSRAGAAGYNLQASLVALTQVTSFTQRSQDN